MPLLPDVEAQRELLSSLPERDRRIFIAKITHLATVSPDYFHTLKIMLQLAEKRGFFDAIKLGDFS